MNNQELQPCNKTHHLRATALRKHKLYRQEICDAMLAELVHLGAKSVSEITR